MSQLEWDKAGEKVYETGSDRGVLYKRNAQGVYNQGFAWNGLTGVTESPSGAEPNKQYADNIVYLNLLSAEEYGGTIEAFTYPIEFEECDGTAEVAPGVTIGQQPRKSFGFSWRSLVGNDLEGTDYGYKIHLVWDALAAPTEKANATVNDSPEAQTFSWEFSTTPTAIGVINGRPYKPSASMVIDSTRVTPAKLAAIEAILYGTESEDPRLPMPAEIVAIMDGPDPTVVSPNNPAYNSSTKVITVPTVTGVVYTIDDEPVTGSVTITEDTAVRAKPASASYQFAPNADTYWLYKFA